MNKIIASILVALLLTGMLTACSSIAADKTDNKKVNIVCTIFPEYDWVREIIGGNSDGANLTLLLDNGVDLHSYQPNADDIVKISSCDLFIYVGGESDAWVNDALKEATNKNMAVINLLEVLGESLKEETVVEGMQSEEHDEDSEEPAENKEIEYDEHVWLSLKNAAVLCAYIADKLGEIDTDNANSYKENAEKYINKMATLDMDYKSAVNAAPQKTLLFADRFPFRYFTDDYGLSYYAAFVGCSAETEASFETVAFLAKKADELNLHSIMVIDGSDESIAKTIIANTSNRDQKILRLNSMQSVDSSNLKAGVTYLSIMENNLTVLKEALR